MKHILQAIILTLACMYIGTSDLKKLLILKKGIGIEKASDEKSM